jgi:hypothetical protein
MDSTNVNGRSPIPREAGARRPPSPFPLIFFGTAAALIVRCVISPEAANDNIPEAPPKSPAPIVSPLPANDDQQGTVFGGPTGMSGAGHANSMTRVSTSKSRREYGGSTGDQGPAPSVVPPAGPHRQFADNVEDAIRQAGQSSGLDVRMLRVFTGIESGGNPSARTGHYHGLFQLSQAEFAALGGKNIYDPYDNARIAAIKLKGEAEQFSRKFGRNPTAFEMYMVHQRGFAGYEQHLKSPDALAWTALYNTAEGRQKGEGWARKTITQNLPRTVLESMGGVEKITNRQFVEWWRSRFEREASRRPVAGAANVSTPERFTVRRNRLYHATVKLSAFERWATNGMIATKLRQFGFTEIEVRGSGTIREAQARWPGPDTTSAIDEHLANVLELIDHP